jgi:pseudouridine kinase
MSARPDILCIGSVLWDVIGRCDMPMQAGNDKPGRITRLPGGVALNIAMTLRRFDLTPALLTVVGDDPDGRDLLAECGRMGLLTEHVVVAGDLPTDRYMAIEAAGGLVAAIADAHSLERVGGRILAPLRTGGWGRMRPPTPARSPSTAT